MYLNTPGSRRKYWVMAVLFHETCRVSVLPSILGSVCREFFDCPEFECELPHQFAGFTFGARAAANSLSAVNRLNVD